MLPPAFVTPPPPASSHSHESTRRVVAVERDESARRVPEHRSSGFERHPHDPHIAASDLYSLRARRRFASYLRLRLLELREQHLERAADVIEGRLPVDVLVPTLRTGEEPRDASPR